MRDERRTITRRSRKQQSFIKTYNTRYDTRCVRDLVPVRDPPRGGARLRLRVPSNYSPHSIQSNPRQGGTPGNTRSGMASMHRQCAPRTHLRSGCDFCLWLLKQGPATDRRPLPLEPPRTRLRILPRLLAVQLSMVVRDPKASNPHLEPVCDVSLQGETNVQFRSSRQMAISAVLLTADVARDGNKCHLKTSWGFLIQTGDQSTSRRNTRNTRAGMASLHRQCAPRTHLRIGCDFCLWLSKPGPAITRESDHQPLSLEPPRTRLRILPRLLAVQLSMAVRDPKVSNPASRACLRSQPVVEEHAEFRSSRQMATSTALLTADVARDW